MSAFADYLRALPAVVSLRRDEASLRSSLLRALPAEAELQRGEGGYRIVVIISVFQTEEGSSILPTRSLKNKAYLGLIFCYLKEIFISVRGYYIC